MSAAKFPATVYIAREGGDYGDDSSFLVAHEDLEALTDGEPVAVYKLVEVKVASVTRKLLVPKTP